MIDKLPASLMERTVMRNTHLYITGQTMFCPGCGAILDARKAVNIDLFDGDKLLKTWVFCGGCFDASKEDLKQTEAEWQSKSAGTRLEIIDGRKLFSRSKKYQPKGLI